MNDEQLRIHREIWQLIPWLVNQSAGAGERQRAESHLRICTDCSDEFSLQTRICAGIEDQHVQIGDAHAAFGRLLARLDGDPASLSDDHAASAARGARTMSAERWMRGLVAAVVVQAVGLVALAAFALQRPEPSAPAATDAPARYETLSSTSATPVAASIRLVPAATLTVGALQALPFENGLRIVSGSEDNAIYAWRRPARSMSTRPWRLRARLMAARRADPRGRARCTLSARCQPAACARSCLALALARSRCLRRPGCGGSAAPDWADPRASRMLVIALADKPDPALLPAPRRAVYGGLPIYFRECRRARRSARMRASTACANSRACTNDRSAAPALRGC